MSKLTTNIEIGFGGRSGPN